MCIIQERSQITLRLALEDGSSEEMTVTLCSDQAADMTRGLLGAGTPMGSALFGHRSGDLIPYRAGDIVSITVLRVRQTNTDLDQNASAQREANLRKAAADSERTNAMLFASSFTGKWGDYDPSAIPPGDDD